MVPPTPNERATVCFSIEHARVRHVPRDAFDVNFICSLIFRWKCFGTKESKYISPKALTKERSKPSSKYCIYLVCGLNIKPKFKEVRAHCYCASLLRTLFIKHARATSFSSARTDSKSQQNIELMTLALTWCANIFVGCSVNPTFFGRSLPFLILFIILKNKKNLCVGSFNYFSWYYSNRVELVHGYRCAGLKSWIFLSLILPDLMTNVAKIY